jgi:hypothetical protein
MTPASRVAGVAAAGLRRQPRWRHSARHGFGLSSINEGRRGLIRPWRAVSVVSTDCRARPGISPGIARPLVPPGDAAALACVAATPISARRRGRARAGFFSVERAAEEYERLMLVRG